MHQATTLVPTEITDPGTRAAVSPDVESSQVVVQTGSAWRASSRHQGRPIVKEDHAAPAEGVH